PNSDWFWERQTSSEGDSTSESETTKREVAVPMNLPWSLEIPLDRKLLGNLKDHLSSQYATDRTKKSRRRKFFGNLLCCNKPPTMAPMIKKKDVNDDQFKEWIMSQLLKGVVHPNYDALGQDSMRTKDPYSGYISSPDAEDVDMRRNQPIWQAGRHVDAPDWEKRGGAVTGIVTIF
ncbi:hypothetical protein PoB_004104600, partial [Plakobranchus ocellatus]